MVASEHYVNCCVRVCKNFLRTMYMDKALAGKKILVLYTAHTVGHQRIAENISYWLAQAGAHIELREVLKSNPSPAVKYFLKVHVWVNTHAPWLWKFLYLWGFWFTMMPLRLPAAWFQKKEIEKIITEMRPDVVLTTQTSPSAVLSVLKREGRYGGLWGIAFSDYHFHRGWVYPRADFYLTNIDAQTTRLTELGVSDKKIFRVGFALPPLPPSKRAELREQFAIPQGSKVLLVGSGSLGVRLPKDLLSLCDQVVAAVSKQGATVRVVVACGRSAEVLAELQQAQPTRPWLMPLPYYDPMSHLYQIADVFMTKPGGLSVAEAGQFGLPLVITHTLPGQEDLNLAYLRAGGYVTSLVDVPHDQWVARVVALLMGTNLRSGGSPNFIQVLVPPELSNLGAFVAQLFHAN